MAGTISPTDFGAILLAAQAQITDFPGSLIPAGACYLTVPDAPVSPMSEIQVGLWMGGGSTIRKNQQGGGRFDTRAARKFTTAIRMRLALDVPYSDLQALTNATLGYTRVERMVVNALQNFQGGGLPFELTGFNDPVRPRLPEGTAGIWTEVRIEWECTYQVYCDTSAFQ